MNKLYFGLLFLFFLCFCEPKSVHSDVVLEKDQMIKLLTQLHLAEAYVNANYTYSDSAKYMYVILRDSVLKAQGTNVAVFDSSMTYYQNDVKSMDEIYAASIDSLSLLEGIAK